MRIDFHGRPRDEPQLRAGLLGCGSHAFRNILPAFQFAPVELIATCDLDGARAKAFANAFGAGSSYDDHREMIEREELDAVFVVTKPDGDGRPQYPRLAIDCLEAGVHVWIEKPPAATCAEIEAVQAAAEASGRNVMVGFKKMFAPANEKAKELSERPDFGRIALVRLEYPQQIPGHEELREFFAGKPATQDVARFVDHLCHPASLLIELVGMPERLYYERAGNGAGVVTLSHASDVVSTIALTWGAAWVDGLERTVIVSDAGRHVVVDNNRRVAYHRLPFPGYGDVPDFYTAGPDETTAVWEPEFSLGQLYNKGLFVLGYYGEVHEFATSVLERRAPRKGTLEDALCVTRILEAFANPPGQPVEFAAAPA